MKKRNLLLVMLAVLLAFGLVMSCGPADEDGTTPGGNTGGNSTATLNSVTANGDGLATTTQLTLTFDKPITNLAAADITLGAGATKGALSGGTGGVYTLVVTGITKDAAVTVTVSKSKWDISGSPKTVNVKYSAAGDAADFFGAFLATYSLNSVNTSEKVTFDKTNVKIDETKNGVAGDHIYFTATKWEKYTVPTWTDASYPSTGGTECNFTVGFRITGKITEAEPGTATGSAGSLYGGTTAPGFSKEDITNGTECWIYLYLDEDGDYLVRSPFSKTGKDNGDKPVKGSDGSVRCYK